MASKRSDPMGTWPKQASDVFQFWISLWPVAPLFGVKWRFADTLGKMVPGMTLMTRATSGDTGAAKSSRTPPPPAPTPEATETKIDEAAEDAVEVEPAAMEAPAREPAAPEPAAPEPAAAEPAAAEPAEVAAGDNELTRIKGIGAAVAKQLNDVGITRLTELASLTDDQVAALDAGLPGIKGRCSRDDWVGQAKALVG
jgi:predicted flap endonuclease-1-like 5' DNA nuclease